VRFGRLGLALLGCAGGADVLPTEAPVQRLTPSEYNRTLQDLFGLDARGQVDGAPTPDPEADDDVEEDDEWEGASPVPWRFPADREVFGFEGMFEGQTTSAYLVEQYQAAAAFYAQYALRSHLFFTCDDWVERAPDAQDACALASLERFAARAFRHPLAAEDADAVRQLYRQLRGELTPQEAIVAAVQAVLQSPEFLYRLDDARYPAFARASRLSFLLWDSMPDATLFEAAAEGKLETAEQVRKQARRMLRDERARAAVVRFHAQWLQWDRSSRLRADRALYSERYGAQLPEEDEEDELDLQTEEEFWSAALVGYRRAFEEEARHFVASTVFDGPGTLKGLLTSNQGFVSTVTVGEELTVSTAELQGATSVGKRVDRFTLNDGNLDYAIEVRRARLDPQTRAGVLTLPIWLVGHAHPVHPAPILRGVFVKEQLACETLGQPPPEAAGATPPDAASAEGTNRERLEAITAGPACAPCHQSINPVGFAFEHYDSVGGYRAVDHGQPVDASGQWAPAGGQVAGFTDAVGLAHALADEPVIADCYVRQWMRYALGRDVPADDPGLQVLQEHFRSRGGKVLGLLEELSVAVAFRRDGGAP